MSMTAEEALHGIAQLAQKIPLQSPSIESLEGDGSERQIFRVFSGNISYIAIAHCNLEENQLFIDYSRRFIQVGIPSPNIIAVSQCGRFYIETDLGKTTLAEKIHSWESVDDRVSILQAYRCVFMGLRKMYLKGGEACADLLEGKHLNLDVFQNDIEYYKREFIGLFGQENLVLPRLEKEWETLCRRLSEQPSRGFVSRDFQARNIMWKNNAPYFIDYQAGLWGPEYYDLASLLYAGKSGLREDERHELIKEYTNGRQEEYEAILDFTLHRRLRSLGSYSYLGQKKQKLGFSQLIIPSLKQLSVFFAFHSQDKRYPETAHFLTTILPEIEKQL